MRNAFYAGLLYLLTCSTLVSADDVVGFWKTINEKSKKTESIIAIYQHDGKYYGRIIAAYNDRGQIDDTIYTPKERAPGVEGSPFYSGLDIIWDLKSNGSKYTDGKIMDPEKGRVYDLEIWRQNQNLIVRGKVWVFGRNQVWLPALDSDFPADFKKPDLTSLTPVIQPVKKRSPISKKGAGGLG